MLTQSQDYSIGAATCLVRQTDALPVHMRAGTRELCKLLVPKSERGNGCATALVRNVCDEADAHGIVLVVWPKPFGEGIVMQRYQLESWYARAFGFVRIQPDPVLMARLPQAARPPLSIEAYATAKRAMYEGCLL